jgi:tRNA(Ile)-lysidine synthase
VAYSGGLDSHVLLHRLIALRDELPEIAGAIHVHHDLSPNADAWAEHCQNICREMGIDCHVSRVAVRDGEGLEDSARRARYAAIEGQLQPQDAVLQAQHQDDQAETFLLQALRGGGPRGLAAMPAFSTLGQGYLVRPMLGTGRQQLHDYAVQHDFHWIEDESNQDTRFDRNYIRHRIIPMLSERWPAATRTLARTAAHSAGLVELADELLQDELQGMTGSRPGTLSIGALQSVSDNRAALLIRAMCYEQGLPVPATSHIQELLQKQLHADADRQIHINWAGAEFRRYRDDLYVMSPQQPASEALWQYDWNGTGELLVPELHGKLSLVPTAGHGISEHIIHRGLLIKAREAGGRCQPAGDHHRRELKTIFQEHAIPPWERQRLPMIYAENELIAIADIVICQHAAARRGEQAYQVVWQSIH